MVEESLICRCAERKIDKLKGEESDDNCTDEELSLSVGIEKYLPKCVYSSGMDSDFNFCLQQEHEHEPEDSS